MCYIQHIMKKNSEKKLEKEREIYFGSDGQRGDTRVETFRDLGQREEGIGCG